jgi:hypothetical protein
MLRVCRPLVSSGTRSGEQRCGALARSLARTPDRGGLIPFPLMSGCLSLWEEPSCETCMPNSPGCLRSVSVRAFSPAGCGFHARDGHHTDVRSHHNPVVAEDAGKMAMHSRRSFCHDRSVVAPNQIPPDFTKSRKIHTRHHRPGRIRRASEPPRPWTGVCRTIVKTGGQVGPEPEMGGAPERRGSGREFARSWWLRMDQETIFVSICKLARELPNLKVVRRGGSARCLRLFGRNVRRPRPMPFSRGESNHAHRHAGRACPRSDRPIP